jgi:hypothetical protein
MGNLTHTLAGLIGELLPNSAQRTARPDRRRRSQFGVGFLPPRQDQTVFKGDCQRGINMLNVPRASTSALSRGFRLARLHAAVGLGASIGLSVAQPNQAPPPVTTDRSVSVQLAQATPSTTTSDSERDTIHGVLSSYYDTRDSAAASAFFGEPTLVVLPNQVVALGTRAEVEAFFDKLVASRKLSGYSYSKLGDHRVKLLSPTTALYSTIAIRMKADGTEMQRSGFTYLLHKGNAGWRIHEIIATDVDKLISAD